jgi:hypothetical protein
MLTISQTLGNRRELRYSFNERLKIKTKILKVKRERDYYKILKIQNTYKEFYMKTF